jgi:hypothetical protein
MSSHCGGGSHNLLASGYYGPRSVPTVSVNEKEEHYIELLSMCFNNQLSEPVLVAQSIVDNSRSIATQMVAMEFINNYKVS